MADTEPDDQRRSALGTVWTGLRSESSPAVKFAWFGLAGLYLSSSRLS